VGHGPAVRIVRCTTLPPAICASAANLGGRWQPGWSTIRGLGTLWAMRTVLLGQRPAEVEDWLQRRRDRGLDIYDEVWGSEYHVAPAAHSRHGELDQQIAEALGPAARAVGLRCLGPVNIGEPTDYRVPDRSVIGADAEPGVYLPTAVIVAEIVSPDDETYAKLPFYFERGVVEVLIVDPRERSAIWYRRAADRFQPAEGSNVVPGLNALAEQLNWPD
jgi:hypothetical protein